MKIILDDEQDAPHKCRVEIIGDGEDAADLVQLFKQAMLGMGFHPDTVKEWFPDEV